MALVVLLKGINVGGHRRFRPSVLAQELKRFGVVNIGATGTFIIRKPVTRTKLRAELQRRLPFEAQVMICSGSDILSLESSDPFAGQPSDKNIVRFVSVLAKKGKLDAALPVSLPSERDWCVRVLQQRGRFVFGVYRREMRTIRYLDQLEKLFGVPVTTRNWNTVQSIVKALRA
jgi:uncharacterized protein (DUF1697 family)